MRVRRGDRVLIYETGRTGKVTGEFVVDEVAYGTPSELLAYAGQAAGEGVGAYLTDCRRATALGVGRPVRWPKPERVREFGLARPPQSYQYLS
jgi:predicted transcriptional regulator